MSIDNRTKSLIAVGASIAANCQPCLTYHSDKAKENGADDNDISDAIETGKAVRTGAANRMDKFASTVGEKDKPACGPIIQNKYCC